MNGPENGIGWCDYTWNPLTGCLHGCRFGPDDTPCYAEVIAERFRGSKGFPDGFAPTYHPDRLPQPARVTTPARIFTCSMADLFGKWVPREQQEAVIAAMNLAPQHTFQCLTKAPWIAKTITMPDHVWMGATVTGGLKNEKVRLDCVRAYPARIRFLSVEPCEGPVDVARAEPHWIILGAATGKGAFQPDDVWIRDIERWADRNNVPIFHKDNLTIRRDERRTEFPDGQTVRPAGYWAGRARRSQDRHPPRRPTSSIGV